jgi:dTMP kinase
VESIDSGRQSGRSGVFITLEGPDGAGKSTQQRYLVERIRARGREVVATREPGGTDLGERIRTVLLESSGSHDPVVDALLFNAARRRLVEEVIRPAIRRGETVVCDRFADSTLAYQGYGGGAPVELLDELNSIATRGLQPDRTILLDLATDRGLERRLGGASEQMTRFETADDHGTEFHKRVREGFLVLARREPERWRVVDASASEANVAESVWEQVRDLFD